ncbi:tumor protein p63-regulated gene 1 protein [Engraulis encrasicolus]|uniref:tumor protein p63-regulated gene 1 protein n=1 Tax=Engraulis encrasicolus TaxID=184585 RepID=UPI002FD06CC1
MMSEGVEDSFNPVEFEVDNVKSSDGPETHELPGGEVSAHLATEEKPLPSAPAMSKSPEKPNRWVNAVDQFKHKRFFVLRPGTLDHAIEEIKGLVNRQQDGPISGIWLMAEVDHWNNEKERLVVLTERTLLICKYDFVMFTCDQIQRIPLNHVDRITQGPFCFPQHSLLKREGEGLRVFWDRLREPAFSSRWNPFSVDYPYSTFTQHPVCTVNEKFAELCKLQTFQEQLTAGAERAHTESPVPGKANGVITLYQPILIEAYVGLMSFISNQNKLGYCLARGNIGF